MKKNIGSQLALYPTPVTVIGAMNEEKPTWMLVAHVGIIDSTYVEEGCLNEEGKIDYRVLKPVLFEFPTYEYLRTGEVIGKCSSFKKMKKYREV